jgi:hypothetical protein
MANQIPELRDLLSHHMLNTPYDTSSNKPERWLTDHLVEQVIDWEIGTTSTEKLMAVFDQHKSQLGTFDLLLWIQSKVDEGEYSDPFEED